MTETYLIFGVILLMLLFGLYINRQSPITLEKKDGCWNCNHWTGNSQSQFAIGGHCSNFNLDCINCKESCKTDKHDFRWSKLLGMGSDTTNLSVAPDDWCNCHSKGKIR